MAPVSARRAIGGKVVHERISGLMSSCVCVCACVYVCVFFFGLMSSSVRERERERGYWRESYARKNPCLD